MKVQSYRYVTHYTPDVISVHISVTPYKTTAVTLRVTSQPVQCLLKLKLRESQATAGSTSQLFTTLITFEPYQQDARHQHEHFQTATLRQGSKVSVSSYWGPQRCFVATLSISLIMSLWGQEYGGNKCPAQLPFNGSSK
jgi:hypothetical protein